MFIFALLFISVINDEEEPDTTITRDTTSETNKATDKTNSTTSDTTKSTTKADEKNGANYIKLSIGFLGLLFF